MIAMRDLDVVTRWLSNCCLRPSGQLTDGAAQSLTNQESQPMTKRPGFAHIVNVTELNETKHGSYLHIAQPVTLKSMVVAREQASSVVDVDLIAVKHKDEDIAIPAGFRWAPPIETYAWQHFDALRDVEPRKPLPRIADIFSSLYEASDADYFIMTNADIGLLPWFYLRVANLIREGYDGMAINRRDLPKEYEGLLLDESRLELMFMLEGQRHGGFDCFVLARNTVPKLDFGNVFVGFPPVGKVINTQIERNCSRYLWLRDGGFTFHLGNDRIWQGSTSPYATENEREGAGRYVIPASRLKPRHRTDYLRRAWSRAKRSLQKRKS